MPKPVYLDAAKRDLAEIYRYLTVESGSLAVGRDFIAKLRAQCSNLASLPGTHGTAQDDLRVGMRSFAFRNYVILFRYAGKRFEIVRIIHGNRDIVAYFRQVDV